jgi:hypothetical protein
MSTVGLSHLLATANPFLFRDRQRFPCREEKKRAPDGASLLGIIQSVLLHIVENTFAVVLLLPLNML